MKRAFVDTSGFFALYSANDADHDRALELFEEANSNRWLLVTTNAVVVETYALLLNRTGESTNPIGFTKPAESHRLAQVSEPAFRNAARESLRRVAY